MALACRGPWFWITDYLRKLLLPYLPRRLIPLPA